MSRPSWLGPNVPLCTRVCSRSKRPVFFLKLMRNQVVCDEEKLFLGGVGGSGFITRSVIYFFLFFFVQKMSLTVLLSVCRDLNRYRLGLHQTPKRATSSVAGPSGGRTGLGLPEGSRGAREPRGERWRVITMTSGTQPRSCWT